MEGRVFMLRVSTPRLELSYASVLRLRFVTDDGWRGVLAGHEPSRATLASGPLAIVVRDDRGQHLRWLATEGGLIVIEPREVSIVTRWATEGATLEALSAAVYDRDQLRGQIELEARAKARRHEIATRRALAALERKVAMP